MFYVKTPEGKSLFCHDDRLAIIQAHSLLQSLSRYRGVKLVVAYVAPKSAEPLEVYGPHYVKRVPAGKRPADKPKGAGFCSRSLWLS